MLAKVTSCALVGLNGTPVTVEVDVGTGVPGFMNPGMKDP